MLLVVKINGSMLSVQHINDDMEKYVSIPQSWRCKNCAFEYVDSINTVTQREVVCDLRNASCHSLVVDRSTDVSIIKMLILYAKFLPRNGTSYKTVFAEILQLTECNSAATTAAIKGFYTLNHIDMQKIACSRDGASVMLLVGKSNGVATLLRGDTPHLVEQHCVAHREGLGIDDVCNHASLMQDVDTLHRTVYTLFCRSSVKKIAFKELAEVLECKLIAFKPLNKVR